MIALGRYLATDGFVGSVPEDYPLWIAADRCHCPPWELAKQSVWWRDRALKIANAEGYARKEKAKHNS